MTPERKRGAPAQPRGHCPNCGKKGLGNTYNAHGRGAYRQCVYCQEATFTADLVKESDAT